MFKNVEWLRDAVFYEIYPQSFYDSNGDGIGDLKGIEEKLDYVKWLGCNAIWINPFYESPFGDAGYDITDFRKVAPRYGTNEDFEALCRSAHEKGIRILCDLVPCHTSIEHRFFRESSKKEKNEYSDFYIWCNDPGSEYPHLNKRKYERDDRYLCSFYAIQPAINYGFYEVTEDWQMDMNSEICLNNQKKLIDVMDYWISLGADGFRVDMAKDIIKSDPKREGTKIFWQKIRQYLDDNHPDIVLISEWSRGNEAVDAGFHMDMFLSGGSLFRNEKPEENYFNYFRKEGKGILSRFSDDYIDIYEHIKGRGYWSLVSGNHDQIRFASIAGGAIDIYAYGKEEGWTREIGIGDAEKAYKRAILLEVLNMTLPGVPCIYQGDEYGEVGGNDPDNRHMMRFETLSLDERNMRNEVAELIHLRRNSMPLLYGDFIPLIDRPDEIIYQRIYLGEKVTVIINRKDLSYEIIKN